MWNHLTKKAKPSFKTPIYITLIETQNAILKFKRENKSPRIINRFIVNPAKWAENLIGYSEGADWVYLPIAVKYGNWRFGWEVSPNLVNGSLELKLA